MFASRASASNILVQHAHLDPPVIAPFHRLVAAEPLRQVTPTGARTRHPQQRIEKSTVIRPRATLALAATRNQGLEPLPLIVPKLINRRDHDRSPKSVLNHRSEERRVGKECSSTWEPDQV